MSTRSTIKYRAHSEERTGFHLFTDYMDDAIDGEPPVNLEIDCVDAAEIVATRNGASVALRLSAELARTLGLIGKDSAA